MEHFIIISIGAIGILAGIAGGWLYYVNKSLIRIHSTLDYQTYYSALKSLEEAGIPYQTTAAAYHGDTGPSTEHMLRYSIFVKKRDAQRTAELLRG